MRCRGSLSGARDQQRCRDFGRPGEVNGQLSQPEQSTRWVRDAQRMRIHVALDEPLDKPLPTGARATVQLYNSEGPFARTFAGLQIHLVSCCTMSINTLARVLPRTAISSTRRMIFARRCGSPSPGPLR
jgi:hypothetical protein